MDDAGHEHLFEVALKAERPTRRLANTVRALLQAGNSPDQLLSELERLRGTLQRQGREADEDRVLEVMDFLVGWSSPHMKIDPSPTEAPEPTTVAATDAAAPRPAIRFVFPGTSGGIWTDRTQAALYRDFFFPPTVVAGWTVAVLDLTGMIPTPGVLQDLLLPLAQKVRGGVYGELSLVVRTHDEGVRDFLRYLSKEYNLPIYIAAAFESLSSAQPLGPLTGTEQTTLNVLVQLGGAVTASQLARAVGIEATAAGNRLVGLASKGFLHRVSSPTGRGDLFQDFRADPSLAGLEPVAAD
jgi:hypothetical protein